MPRDHPARNPPKLSSTSRTPHQWSGHRPGAQANSHDQGKGELRWNYRAKTPPKEAREEAARKQGGEQRGAGKEREGKEAAELTTLTAKNGPSILPMKDDGKPLEHMDGTILV